jgi:TPR repeat protein
MKKIILLLFFSFSLFAQNLYFSAYKDIQKAKRLLNSDPQKSERLFIEAFSYLKQLVNTSIDNEKPSANALSLLGEMYLNGWGVDKNEKKAVLLLCGAQQLGNFKAKKLLKKINVKCKKINFKELKQ